MLYAKCRLRHQSRLLIKMKHILLLLVMFSLAGCISASQIDLQSCDISIDFSVSDKVNDRDILDFNALTLSVNNHYNQQPVENPLNIELKKAYLGRSHLILTANAVIKVITDDEVSYFRSNEADTNMISSSSEWQYALEVAVFESIDKAILAHSPCQKRSKHKRG